MSDPASASASPTRFECVVPILRVTDLRASLRWYQAVLGFSKDWESGIMLQVSRDGRPLMLCEQDQGHVGGWVWFGVEDVTPLHVEYSAKGAEILLPPTNFSWAYEIRVEDPDGNVLRFGSEPRADQPFADKASQRSEG